MDIQLNYHSLWAGVAGFIVIQTVLVTKYLVLRIIGRLQLNRPILWTSIALTVISLPTPQGEAWWDVEQGGGGVNLSQGGQGGDGGSPSCYDKHLRSLMQGLVDCTLLLLLDRSRECSIHSTPEALIMRYARA